MYRHPADAKLSRYRARTNAVPVHRPDLFERNGRLSTLVHSVGLGSCDARLLALSDEASFEFSNHPENRHEDGTGDIRRRELRLKNDENRASLSEVMNEVQNIAGVTAQPIQLQDHKLVTLTNEG